MSATAGAALSVDREERRENRRLRRSFFGFLSASCALCCAVSRSSPASSPASPGTSPLTSSSVKNGALPCPPVRSTSVKLRAVIEVEKFAAPASEVSCGFRAGTTGILLLNLPGSTERSGSISSCLASPSFFSSFRSASIPPQETSSSTAPMTSVSGKGAVARSSSTDGCAPAEEPANVAFCCSSCLLLPSPFSSLSKLADAVDGGGDVPTCSAQGLCSRSSPPGLSELSFPEPDITLPLFSSQSDSY